MKNDYVKNASSIMIILGLSELVFAANVSDRGVALFNVVCLSAVGLIGLLVGAYLCYLADT